MTAGSPSTDQLLAEINAATEETVLRGAISRAQHAIAADCHSGVSALTAAWSAVLCHGVAAGLRLVPGSAEWTWFTSGSVARNEAVPGSDVETMVVLGDRITDRDKADLLRRAADVHALVERCGIYGDANGVMASRPRFCRRAKSWSEGIEQWTAEPHRDRGVVMTGLMADSAGLTGAAGLADDALRGQVASAALRNYPVRQAMLQDATAVRASVPSRLRVLTRNADSVDLKLAVMDPIVKIARWAALSSGSRALCTPTRLDAAVAADVLDADDAVTLHGCFEWLLGFRWRTRAAGFLASRPAADVVSLAELAPQDRAALRSVAREVSGISRKLSFLASTSAYR